MQAEPKELQTVSGEEQEVPLLASASVVGLYLLLFAFVLVRGGKGIPSLLGFSLCSDQYWVFTLVFTVLCVGIVGWLGLTHMREYRQYRQLGYQLEADGLVWTPWKAVQLAVTALLTALGMGLLGVPGVSLVTSLLRVYGLGVEVATASSTILCFFTSSLSFLQFAVAGQANYDYGVFLGLAGVFGSLLGIQRCTRSSLLLYLLGLIFALAASGMATFGAFKMLSQWTNQVLNTHFNSYC